MADDDQADKKQIGLTPEGNQALDSLMLLGLFEAEVDAYRFAITYAIAAGLRLEDAPKSGYVTKYAATGTLDQPGIIRDLLSILGIGEVQRPYATAERLAELGVRALATRIEAHEALDSILTGVSAPEPPD